MTVPLTGDDFQKIVIRLHQMGLTSNDEKIEYLKRKNPETIDNQLKELGLNSTEDINHLVEFFSLEKSLEPLQKGIQDMYADIGKSMEPVLQQLQKMYAEINKQLATIDFEKISRELFLLKLFKHVHGDVRRYVTNIYELGEEWGCTVEQINRFAAYLEEKGYVKTERVLGQRPIAAIKLTARGVDYVEAEYERASLGTEK